MKAIYLDHAATTPMHPKVIESMLPVYQDVFGNPSSVHQFGRKARRILDEARRTIAKSIGASEKEIIFTSSGTEADNLALIGTARANRGKGDHVITTAMEHHATLHAAKQLEKEGFRVTYLHPDKSGLIGMEELEAALTEDTTIVSVMTVNNETGMIQPIKEIGELLEKHQAYFHTDAVQAYGVLDVSVAAMKVDMLTVSGHKINGPKGIGFLYAKEGTQMQTLHYGGEQERKRRPGTENLPGVKGLQTAVQVMLEERESRMETYHRYKKLFLETLEDEQIEFTINGELENMAPTIINLSFPGMNVETMLTNLDLAGVAASSGSACTAGSVEPSHVLSAMYGKEDARTINSIRFSFGMANNEENVVDAAKKISQVIKRLSE
ncbi:cysteine desulfurase [Thalassobacillus cyri]|uniref:cysteine desulfurase n=1 Tax=Thalassobacillus cyri TaxID=571932 RepID=A0A1H4FCU2_9BACI|nr:cysteine desulfurase family protein [Thalassobacillus cyri]SEA95169.1 cysteine desulfurase [Thalassobacillus cyri]